MDFKKPPQSKDSLGQDLTSPQAPARPSNGSSRSVKLDKFYLTSHFILLISITVLLVAVLFFTVNTRVTNQNEFVNHDRFQAVFLDDGQVYFGNLIEANQDFMTLTNGFYTVNESGVNPGDLGSTELVLEKVGCEESRPTDRTIINTDRVVSWQNLQDSSDANTVPGAIKDYFRNDRISDCERLTIEATSDTSQQTQEATDQSQSTEQTNNSDQQTNDNTGNANEPAAPDTSDSTDTTTNDNNQ